MILPTLQEKIGEAMKAHDSLRVETLRMLLSEFNYEKIAKQHDLNEEEETTVVRREAKKRRDAIEAYKKAGAEDRAKKEEDELKILQEFLPPEMDEATLSKLVLDAIRTSNATSKADLGKVIGMVKAKAPNVDGGKIAQIANSKLNG